MPATRTKPRKSTRKPYRLLSKNSLSRTSLINFAKTTNSHFTPHLGITFRKLWVNPYSHLANKWTLCQHNKTRWWHNNKLQVFLCWLSCINLTPSNHLYSKASEHERKIVGQSKKPISNSCTTSVWYTMKEPLRLPANSEVQNLAQLVRLPDHQIESEVVASDLVIPRGDFWAHQSHRDHGK